MQYMQGKPSVIGSISGPDGEKLIVMNDGAPILFGDVSQEILSLQVRRPQRLSKDTPIYWAYKNLIVQFADISYADSHINEALSADVTHFVVQGLPNQEPEKKLQ